jgi:hypothetical protein
VDGITTPYNIAANNYIVGCHEGSLIATNNTTEDDFKAIYDEVNASALAQGAGSIASNAEADSLVRAIADIARTGGTTPNAITDAIEADSLDHLLKTNLPTNPATDIAANSALGHAMGTANMASFDRGTDSLQSIRDSADTGYVNVIKIIGEGGHAYTAQAATKPGDDVSTMGALRYISNLIENNGGFGGGKVQKDITFANLAAPATLFTVTGDVVVRIVAHCTTLCASAGGCNAEVGTAADPDAIIATTDVLNIDTGEIWHDATPDSAIEALSTIREYIIVGGADIIITPSLQIDTGAITFFCFWTPLNSTGNVVSA